MTTDDQIRERVENALNEAADAADGLGSVDPNFPPDRNVTREDEIVQTSIQLALMAMSADVSDTDTLVEALEHIRLAQGRLMDVESPA